MQEVTDNRMNISNIIFIFLNERWMGVVEFLFCFVLCFGKGKRMSDVRHWTWSCTFVFVLLCDIIDLRESNESARNVWPSDLCSKNLYVRFVGQSTAAKRLLFPTTEHIETIDHGIHVIFRCPFCRLKGRKKIKLCLSCRRPSHGRRRRISRISSKFIYYFVIGIPWFLSRMSGFLTSMTYSSIALYHYFA